MAYRKEKQRYLGGSLSLVPATDELSEGDALRLENWRVDQAGQLKSRRGMILDTSTGFPINALFRHGNDRYGGVNGDLRHGVTFGTFLANGFDGEKLGFAAYRDFVWVMNRGRQGKARGAEFFDWLPDAPTTAPTAAAGDAGNLTGDFIFYITYETGLGHETGPSPPSNEVTLSGQNALLTDIPVSDSPEVTRKNVYLIGGDLDAPLFIEAMENGDTEWEITLSIEFAQNQNRVLSLDVGPPPEASGVVGPYFGRLVAWSSADHVSRIWWTPTGQPWAWPGSDDDFSGNWMDVGDDGEAILACENHTRMLVIYKERSIWRLIGDPDDADPEQSASDIGPVGKQAVCSAGTNDYFVGPEGVHRFTGDWPEKISGPINPIFQGDYTDLGGGVSAPPLNPAARHLCCIEHVHGRLYMAYPDATSGEPNIMLVYDIATGRWSHYRTTLGTFSTLYYEGPGSGSSFLAGVSGSVYQMEVGITDSGSPINVVWQSRYLDQGLPDNPKIYADLVIVYRTAESGQTPSSLTVKFLYDNGSVENVGSISGITRRSTRFPLGDDNQARVALNGCVLIEGSVSSTVTIFDVYVHWYPEARKAKTFDSGVVDLAKGNVGEIEAVELDITAPADVTLTVQTDLPGSTFVARATKVWPGFGNRRTLFFQFAARPEGRRARFVLTGGNDDFQLHRFRYKVLPIGVYIDGAIDGSSWEPEAIAP